MSKKSKKSSKSKNTTPAKTERTVCRLFLATPTSFDIEAMTGLLKAALEGGDIACLMIGHEDNEVFEKAAHVLTPIAQEHDVAVLIEGSVDLALKVGADGVVVAGFKDDYTRARDGLGDEKIVGVDCGVDRHAAMALGELGADFVIFDDEKTGTHQDEIETETPTQLNDEQVNEPVANWWARVFEVPCVVMAPQSSANAIASIKSGVEFLCPTSQMWKSAQAAQTTVKEFNQWIKDTPIDEG